MFFFRYSTIANFRGFPSDNLAGDLPESIALRALR